MVDQYLLDKIIQHSRSIQTLESIMHLLNWDQETMMPFRGHTHRTEQQILLASIIHDKKCDPSFFTHLEKAYANVDETSDSAIIIRKLYRDITKEKKLPSSFVMEFTKATSEGLNIWQEAKVSNNWKLFQPHLEQIVSLVRQKTEYLGFKDHPYDALLDEYEPEAKTAELSRLFSSLQSKLMAVFQEVKNSAFYNYERPSFSTNLSEQMLLSRDVLSFIGYDWERGRLDTSEHPFCTSMHPSDNRITIWKSSDDLLDQVMSAMHEAGHGFYDMGLNWQQFGTPLAQPISLSIHESQSRFWETVIGRSEIFCSHLFSMMQNRFKEKMPYTSHKQIYTALNRVSCSFIRTQADEVTYPLHIILRFEIEKSLLDGSLSVCDIPERWNAGMKELLGIYPTSDREGCLQDIHWSMGMFGYFPTYTLGSWYAICLFSAMQKAVGNLNELLSKGLFSPIHAYLHEHVWRHGRRFLSQEIIAKALGRAPSEDDYISYLRKKYLS